MQVNEAFGIVDEAYFVPKSELYKWMNDLLKINVTKVEELGSGAIYCQILDSMYPDKVEKLSKCRQLDNLEMIQWLKRFFDCNGGAKPNYDPVERRKNNEPDFNFAQKIVQPKFFDPNGNQIYNKSTQEKKVSTTSKPQKENINTNVTTTTQTKEAAKHIQQLPNEQIISKIKQIILSQEDDNEKIRLITFQLGLSENGQYPALKALKYQQKQQQQVEEETI